MELFFPRLWNQQPSPHTHLLAGSVTINAKTTVQCSPGSSMVHGIYICTAMREVGEGLFAGRKRTSGNKILFAIIASLQNHPRDLSYPVYFLHFMEVFHKQINLYLYMKCSPGHYFGLKYLNSLMWIRDGMEKLGSEIRDGKKSDPGSGINIPEPQYCQDQYRTYSVLYGTLNNLPACQ